MALPDFTADQRKRLTKLGVLPEQIEPLRYAVFEVKRALRAPPARNATAKVLADVTKHADALAELLAKMWNPTDAAHAAAMNEVEQQYWKARPGDIEATSAQVVIPRLIALADAARDAVASMPPDQSRHRTASGRGIRQIDDALLNGWIDAQGQRQVRIIDGMEFKAALPPYPDKFHPRESESFRGIVALCYEAAGAPRDYEPLAAIRAYARSKKRQREGALAVITEASRVVQPVRKPRPNVSRGYRQ